MSSTIEEYPESIRIEIRMADHVKVIEMLPGDGGYPALKAELGMNREAIEVPPWEHMLPYRVRVPSRDVDITLKVTCGKATYSRVERPTEGETAA